MKIESDVMFGIWQTIYCMSGSELYAVLGNIRKEDIDETMFMMRKDLYRFLAGLTAENRDKLFTWAREKMR